MHVGLLGFEHELGLGFDDADDALAGRRRVERERGVGELAELLGPPFFLGQQAIDLGFRLFAFDDVAEDEHTAGNLAVLVANRGGAVVDRDLDAIFANQERVIRQADDDPLGQHAVDGIHGRLARGFIDDPQHVLERLALGIVGCPAGERRGDWIDEHDSSVGVGGDHGVADAGKRGAEVLALVPQIGRG